MPTITPTPTGSDLDSADKRFDAHIRLEVLPGKSRPNVFVDVFDSSIEDNDRAHVESEYFTLSRSGVTEASDFLKGYGFDVTVVLPRK